MNSGNDFIIINPMVAHESIIASTDRGIKEGFNSSKQDKSLEWIKPSEEEFEKSFRCILKHRLVFFFFFFDFFFFFFNFLFFFFLFLIGS